MRLLDEIKKDFITTKQHFGASFWQVLRLAGVKILISYRIRSAAKRHKIPLINAILAATERTVWGIELSVDAQIGSVIILHPVAIVIGKSTIGDGCIFCGSNTIGGRYKHTTGENMGNPQIGRNVEFGAGARILGAISIGDNVKIGANAVVIRNIPAGAIAIGVPATYIKRK